MATPWCALPARSEPRLAVLIVALLGFALAGCGVPERDNLLDPINANAGAAQLLLGTWTREDAEANEVYTFREGGGVQYHSYRSRVVGPVQRSAGPDTTEVLSFTGTYALVGNRLRVSYTQSQTNQLNDPPPALPLTDLVIDVLVGARELELVARDGTRVYTRM